MKGRGDDPGLLRITLAKTQRSFRSASPMRA